MTLTLLKRTTLLLACTLLSACVTPGFGPDPVKPVAVEPDIVGLRIAEAAEKATGALNTISGIEQARSPNVKMDNAMASSVSPELAQAITVKWTGPAAQILQTLAVRAGLRFETKGNQPSVPLIVNINVYQKPMIEVLRDIGLQVGHRADVLVNSKLGMIEIRYAPNNR